MTTALILTYFAANVGWFILFFPRATPLVNFWIGMATASGALALSALILQRKAPQKHWEFRGQHILIGVGSAALLYGVFFIGHKLSTMLLPFAGAQVHSIYAMKAQMAPTTIALLLFFWIGPAEEIFWRGFLQQRLSARLGSNTGYIVATVLYAAVHLYALNFMLFMAALICAAFWGYLYKRTGSLWPVIISHAIWDVIIFVVLPIK